MDRRLKLTLLNYSLFFLRATLDFTMATDDKDAQNTPDRFATGSESVNIELCEDSHRREEESELSQTVCR